MKRLIVLAAAIAMVAAACADRGPGSVGPVPSGGSSPVETPTQRPTSEPTGETMTYEVWFASGQGYLFMTQRTEQFSPAMGRAALTALLAGPSDAERDADVTTAVPNGTELLGLTIEDGTATVDLSREFASGGGSLSVTMRLAQVVYTITQFRTVHGVMLELDGKPVEVFSGEGLVLDRPMTRRSFDDLLPPILVESPVVGQEVSSPVTIAGTANVFEATVSISIYDANGNEIVRTFTTATCGTGCRGTYSEAVGFEVGTTQRGVIEVYESSAKDASKQFPVRIPVVLGA